MDNLAANPVNQNSKRYTMKQAFDVWYANKDSILFDVSVGVHHGENYKLARPHQLYHLDMHQSSAQKQQESQEKNEAELESRTEALHVSSSARDEVAPVTDDFLSLSLGGQPENAANVHEKPLLRPPNLPQPAGLFSNSAADGLSHLIQPENIKWIYLDASGNEQGPFTGDVMQEWLGDGYLSPDLKIRREEQQTFQTLRLFCESTKNFILPFKTPLPAVAETQNYLGGANPMSSHPGPFGSVPDAVSAQGTGVSMTSSGLFGATQQSSGPVSHQQLQTSFNTNLYPQMMSNNSFGGAALRALSSNLMFDYNTSKDYSMMNPQFNAGSQFGLDALNQNIGGGFGQLHMPSLLHQQIHGQQPMLSRSNSGWAVDNSLPGQMPQALGAVQPSPLAISQQALGGPSLSQPSPMSPWLNRVLSSRAASPFIPTASLANEDTILNDLHSSMVTGILNDEEPSMSYFQSRDVNSNEASRAKTQNHNTLAPDSVLSVLQNVESDPVAAKSSSGLKNVVSESVVEESFAEPALNSSSAPVEAPVEAEPEVPEVAKPAEESAPVAPSPSVLAPWAKKAPEQETPVVSLKEIQRMEAEWLEKEKQTKAEMQRELAIANAIAASKMEERSAPALEKVPSFNWALSSQEAVAKKTLAEIQKEEEEAAARARAMSKTASGTAAMKTSLASTLASSVPKEEFGGAWTTVAKKPIVKRSTQQVSTPTVSYSSMTGAINPQALRSASSNDVASSSINSTGLKEDFLVWARNAMTNLYPSVSKDDLLEVFTTLPLHGDSQQLISETIYSSSATMDGRRFAQEFLKKRQQVERQIGANAVGSWSAAISSSADKTPAVDDDGWSTSVKSKKKGRK
ncbi:hypothetical protein PUMCH_003764 [Australozyma saopauloensis]|uniref:GYF domain-containing protein n=1 Tax=Australozyma saopauloensis TaxID=291208 RepID=A0AAX4HCX0_9ASCO|nr:hypothetical protein PUMCH_003764 [[Candida] saopauloensis]